MSRRVSAFHTRLTYFGRAIGTPRLGLRVRVPSECGRRPPDGDSQHEPQLRVAAQSAPPIFEADVKQVVLRQVRPALLLRPMSNVQRPSPTPETLDAGPWTLDLGR